MYEKNRLFNDEQPTEYCKGVVNVTYIDRLNHFYRYIVYNNIPPHAQLFYLHLLNVANQTGWQEKFCITDRRLEILTGLSSKAIADAKRILKDRFVTIKTNKNKPRQGTCYSLLNFLHSMESKTESKTESKREVKSESKIESKLDSLPSITISKIKEGEENTDGAGARVCVGAEQGLGKLSEAIKAAWGDGLDFSNAYDVRALEVTYGTDAVVKAINAAKNSLRGNPLTIAYVEGTLRNMKERSERDVQNNRNERRSSSNKPAIDERFSYRSRYDDL